MHFLEKGSGEEEKRIAFSKRGQILLFCQYQVEKVRLNYSA